MNRQNISSRCGVSGVKKPLMARKTQPSSAVAVSMRGKAEARIEPLGGELC